MAVRRRLVKTGGPLLVPCYPLNGGTCEGQLFDCLQNLRTGYFAGICLPGGRGGLCQRGGLENLSFQPSYLW